jgi:hypothetical protein
MRYGLGVHIWEVRRETEQQMQMVGTVYEYMLPAEC